jgi:hypothetical protein
MLWLASACSEECVEEACEAALRAQPAADLEHGIAGVVAYRTDACVNGCCECSYSMTTLRIYAVDEPLRDIEDAQLRLQDELDFTQVDASERYAQALEPGRYAVCDSTVETCANVVIEEGEVLTVNVQTRYGPTSLRVFDPEGKRLMDAVVGLGAPY